MDSSEGSACSSDSVTVDMEFFLDDLALKRLFLSLNFSNQLVLLAFRWLSEVPTELAKKRAFSRIMESETAMPCFSWLRAQFDKALSISGNLPLDLLMGDRLPSSEYKYFSLLRRTFETVLQLCQNPARQRP
jgi:hypothetical protein